MVVHSDPVWRERADFVIRCSLGDYGHEGRAEQLWAAQRGPYVFELCCLPFFTYGIALGDVVTTDPAYTLRQVDLPSGHRVIRVAFTQGQAGTSARNIIRAALTSSGCCEWYSADYVAIDVPSLSEAARWQELLEPLEAGGGVTWEFGSEAPPPPV
jgi:hypothetical protein